MKIMGERGGGGRYPDLGVAQHEGRLGVVDGVVEAHVIRLREGSRRVVAVLLARDRVVRRVRVDDVGAAVDQAQDVLEVAAHDLHAATSKVPPQIQQARQPVLDMSRREFALPLPRHLMFIGACVQETPPTVLV